MSSKGKIVAAVVALVAVGGAVAAVAFSVSRPAAEVEVATVATDDLAVTVTASGRIESDVRADVFPPTAGMLAEVRVTDGQAVEKGAVLAVMDTDALRVQVAGAEAGLAQAEAALKAVDDQAPGSAEVAAARGATDAAWAAYRSAQTAASSVGSQGPRASELAAAAEATRVSRSIYDQMVAAYELADAAYQAMPTPETERDRAGAAFSRDQAYASYLATKASEDRLRATNLAPQQAQADAAVQQAYAAYLGARAQQEQLEGLDLSPQRRAARAAVEQARETLAIAEDNLAKAELVAPIDGVVLFNPLGTPAADGSVPMASPGAGVAPQAAPFTVVQLDAVRFTADVDEVDVDLVETGMNATVRLDALPDRSLETTVTEIRPAATLTLTGGTVFPVYLRLEAVDAKLLIGMKGDVVIEVSRQSEAITIPIEALFDEADGSFAYVVEDGRLVRTPIEVGTITETSVEVLSGLRAGQEVALSSATEYEDGMAVRVR